MAGSISQFYVEDDSPEIAYFPYVGLEPSQNLTNGWQFLYNGSGAATAPGQVGVGTSSHYTGLNGASFLITWNGTGIDLMGTAVDASYQITLDGNTNLSYSSDAEQSILASFHDLDNTNHTLLLTTIITTPTSPNSFVTFDKALLTYAPPAGTDNTTATSQTITDADQIAFVGQWSYVADGSGNSMHEMGSEPKSVGSAVTIYGLISSYSGNYTVTLDNVSTALSAQSAYNDSEALLFYATGLSQDALHQIVVTNDENRTLAVRVGGMNVTAFGDVTISDTNTSTSSTPAGTIAALVLAAVLILLILAIALYYFRIIRPRSHILKQNSLRHDTSSDEKNDPDMERVIDISPPPAEEDVEVGSLSTSKGYGFGLGLRLAFPFAHRKSKSRSNSSGISRNGNSSRVLSDPMTPQYDRDDKRLSINTLTADLPVLGHAPESEKLAPGWTNPVTRTPQSKGDHTHTGSHGFLLPELRVEDAGATDDDDESDVDAKTLTSRQDEALAATLSLSPRTSEAPPAFGAAMGMSIRDDHRIPRRPERNSQFLQVRETSPFRLDVGAIISSLRGNGNHDSRRTSGSGGSTWSKVRARLYRRAHRDDGRSSHHTDRQESSSSSGPESVPVVMLDSGSAAPPSDTAPGSGTYSFLDFTSSRASLRRQSRATTLSSTPADNGHGHTRNPSNWNDSSSIRMVRIERSRDKISTPKPDAPSTVSRGSHTETPSDHSNGLSPQTTYTHGSSPFPFPVTIPPSLHIPHPFNAVHERQTSPSPSPLSESIQSVQRLQVPQPSPRETASAANSPTESVPFSVSDIHFRHSVSDYAEVDSRRASDASNLPPHPPLPHRDGSQPGTPFTPPPPYVVQRVLGMTPVNSPTLAAWLAAPSSTPSSTPTSSQTVIARPSQFRMGTLLGPRPRPSTAGSTGSARGTAAPQLPMQGGRGSLRGPR
ncbi:hypothetical protein F5I97DRAFT_1925473 [Phlebopus sp. FC_14]|nr:hypothetical protein F5I97DRAFT_1925473 [Phlebopus sp. FC_14]